MQVLNEFYANARKKFSTAISAGDARALVRRYEHWRPWQNDQSGGLARQELSSAAPVSNVSLRERLALKRAVEKERRVTDSEALVALTGFLALR